MEVNLVAFCSICLGAERLNSETLLDGKDIIHSSFCVYCAFVCMHVCMWCVKPQPGWSSKDKGGCQFSPFTMWSWGHWLSYASCASFCL